MGKPKIRHASRDKTGLIFFLIIWGNVISAVTAFYGDFLMHNFFAQKSEKIDYNEIKLFWI